MASDLRAQSGIDDALRTEGLADDIAEIRKLARGELDAVQRAAVDTGPGTLTARSTANDPSSSYRGDFFVVRDREYPRDGADSYGALPDNAIVYAEGLPKSKLARDPLYMLGDPNGVVPEPAPPPVFPEELAKVDVDAKVEADGDAKAEANGDAARDPSEAETQDPPAVALSPDAPASEAG